ncbi:alpha/beta hydrolase [soil metagenome]
MTEHTTHQDPLFGAEERTVRVGGIVTRYLIAGDPANDPVLLLHDGAWGASAEVTWGSFIPRLSSDYCVIAPDLIGYGRSDKVAFVDRAPHDSRIDQLSALVDTLNVTKPIHLVGNSFGGAVALRALARPRAFNFRSVVSIAGSGGPGRTPLSIEQLGKWDGTREDLSRVLALLVDEDFDGFEAQLDARFTSARQPGHYRSVIAPSAPIPESLRLAGNDPWPAQIAATEVPILLVHCMRDVLLEDDWAANLRVGVPHAQVVEVDGKHAVQLDHPDDVEEALSQFFASLPTI